jgi:serine/threonine-protein kinase
MRRGFRDSAEPALGQGDVVASTYHVRREITRVHTGAVFEAHDTMLDRLVALKLAWRDPGTPSLVSEARRCAALRDPCSVQVHGMGVYEGVEYAVAERVQGKLLRDDIDRSLSVDLYLARLRRLIAAIARAHEAGVAAGVISGSTVLVMPEDRLVLGRLSLSQVPSAEPRTTDILAAQLADIYGLGGIAIEMAGGPPVGNDSPPPLNDVRPDLPSELSDLVEWLLVSDPAGRPQSAHDVLAQVDAVIERIGTTARSLRVLFVDDDAARARWLWGLGRRAHPAAIVETAGEGTDAAHKLNRDQPDLVFINAALRGVMNAFELCMYARGLESDHYALGQILVIGNVSERDQALFANVGVKIIPDDALLPSAILEKIRGAMVRQPRTRNTRRISG